MMRIAFPIFLLHNRSDMCFSFNDSFNTFNTFYGEKNGIMSALLNVI